MHLMTEDKWCGFLLVLCLFQIGESKVQKFMYGVMYDQTPVQAASVCLLVSTVQFIIFLHYIIKYPNITHLLVQSVVYYNWCILSPPVMFLFCCINVSLGQSLFIASRQKNLAPFNGPWFGSLNMQIHSSYAK